MSQVAKASLLAVCMLHKFTAWRGPTSPILGKMFEDKYASPIPIRNIDPTPISPQAERQRLMFITCASVALQLTADKDEAIACRTLAYNDPSQERLPLPKSDVQWSFLHAGALA